MRILSIMELDKKRKKICLDNGECFTLYDGEIRKYQIEEEMELEDSVYQKRLYPVLEKRARERMLYLLKDSDKTEQQIRKKLKEGYYPLAAIESAVAFGKKYHYIDDERYTENYMNGKGKKLSRKELEYKLIQQGIARETFQNCYKNMENQEEWEEEAMERLLRKKNVNFSKMTPEGRQKVYAYLIRKGFSYEGIIKKVNEFESSVNEFEHLN